MLFRSWCCDGCYVVPLLFELNHELFSNLNQVVRLPNLTNRAHWFCISLHTIFREINSNVQGQSKCWCLVWEEVAVSPKQTELKHVANGLKADEEFPLEMMSKVGNQIKRIHGKCGIDWKNTKTNHSLSLMWDRCLLIVLTMNGLP